MGPEGLEPPLPGSKGRCAAVTPQPLATSTSTPTPSHSGASQARPAGFEPARQRFWRPPAPPVAPVVCACGGESPVRESNPPPRLERAVSSSARRTGVRFLSLPRRDWAVWRSNPRLHLFRVALYRLSYRSENGQGPVLVTPGPGRFLIRKNQYRPSVSQVTSGTEIARQGGETPLLPPTRLTLRPAGEHGD